ncbi:glycosyltransferase family 4 protein [Trinickia sp. NRRL B-1857]|uniref:MraY family glycosyltransferase n=1 Tax=Trinickia sp. NRRL B-1857 TaxID=3162879 RepID=UPI003D2BDCB3
MAIDLTYVSPLIRVVVCAVLACVACVAILQTLLRTGLAWRLATDIPNERSLHERPTPRVGGWGIVPVVLVAMILTSGYWVIAGCVAFLAAVSQIDDRRGLPARVRFAAHVAAVVVVLAVYRAPVLWWVSIVLAIALVWLINLYNFMDGSDGLAGGMALFGFGGYTIAALTSSHPDMTLALTCAGIAGAAAGFLTLNFHPARIFLGDAGSIPMGFLAGTLGYLGWRSGVWPFWFPVMAFAPFIGDASVTLARRLARGEKFWQAHREHFYQRMVRSGVGHRRTALRWYAVMLVGIILAVGALDRPGVVQLSIVVVWACVLALMGLAIDARWRRSASDASK